MEIGYYVLVIAIPVISYLNGTILNKLNNYLIINVSGVGYKVFVYSNLYNEISAGEEISLYIHEQVGEQILALYGLKNIDELNFFELLISVSGIGPKTALGIMNIAPVAEIQISIREGDHSLLSQASGIGKKTAERAVLELRNKISEIATQGQISSEITTNKAEEIDALIVLGYTIQQARDALRNIDPEIKDSGERIKRALQQITHNK